MARCTIGLASAGVGRRTVVALAAAMLLIACADDGKSGDPGDNQGGSAGVSNSSGGASDTAMGGSGSSSGGKQGKGGSASGGKTATSSGGTTSASNGGAQSGGKTAAAGGPTAGTAATDSPVMMPLISRNAPAFASNSAIEPKSAVDDDHTTSWASSALPAYIALDLSGAPKEQRQQVLISIDAWHLGGYINDAPQAYGMMPIDYTIEANDAAGGGAAPTSGWKTLMTVTDNARVVPQHIVQLAGANWLRLNITRSSDPKAASFDLFVYSAPNGGTDDWLFLGDSITFMSTDYPGNDIPKLVEAVQAGRWPIVIDAAIGGTSTYTVLPDIDKYLSQFPGRYVVLAYGTNDQANANDFKMEDLVKAVIAAGKIPVVPHMPWSDQKLEAGPFLNGIIDGLYVKYPQILKGPDLWAFFLNRTDLIAPGDVHPNTMGQEELRKQWAQVIAAVQ